MGRERKDPQTGLSVREARFVEHYVRTRDGVQAREAAGYAASTAVSDILARPAVARAVNATTEAVIQATQIDVERVVQELASLAFADPRRVFTPEGGLRPIVEWDAGTAACIASVDIVKTTTRMVKGRDGEASPVQDQVVRVRMWDKPKALELLAKHLGMLTEKIEIKGDADLIDRLAAARRRVVMVGVSDE